MLVRSPPKPEPADGEEVEEEEEEVAPLAPISGDKPVIVSEEGELSAWTLRLCFTQATAYTIAVATSHRWPGAYSMAVQKADKFSSVYFGYGFEYTGTSFTPQAPPPISTEVNDPEELPEVTLSSENELLKVRLAHQRKNCPSRVFRFSHLHLANKCRARALPYHLGDRRGEDSGEQHGSRRGGVVTRKET